MQVLKGELAILMIIVIGGMGRPQPQSARDKLQPGGDMGSQTGNRKNRSHLQNGTVRLRSRMRLARHG